MKKLILSAGIAILFSGMATARINNGGFETWQQTAATASLPFNGEH